MNYFKISLFSPFLKLGIFVLLFIRCSPDEDSGVNPSNKFVNLNSSEIEILKHLNSDERRLNAAKIHGLGSINVNNEGGRMAAVEVESPTTLSRDLSPEARNRLNLLTHANLPNITGWELTAVDNEAIESSESYLIILGVDGNYYYYDNGRRNWEWGYYYTDSEVTKLAKDLGSETEASWDISLLEEDSLILTADGSTFHYASSGVPENSSELMQLSELYDQLIGKTYVVSRLVKSTTGAEFNMIGEKRNWGVNEPDGSYTNIDQGISIFKYQFTRDSVIVELYYVREENLENALDIPDNEKISHRFDRNALSIESFADSYPHLLLERGRNRYDFDLSETRLYASMSFLYGLDSEIQFVQAPSLDYCNSWGSECDIWTLISEDEARKKLRILYGG